METVALVILLLVALALVGVVLLQRNEGGGLGMGSGGPSGTRSQGTALQRATWVLGGAFMIMSLVLTVLAAQQASDSSVVDQLRSGGAVEEEAPALPDLGGDLLPPPATGNAPLVPTDN